MVKLLTILAESGHHPPAMLPHSLGRAVDQDDNVLGIVVQSRHTTQTAKTCFRTLLKGLTYGPRVSITDPRKSDGAAQREMLPDNWLRVFLIGLTS
jgi:transposase-like protein